ncbi:CIC11C00000002952 [Sungouiella intermedia]|uniref:CIC11C00000002952 n=1 Tax=Sungouiella intermedia TaxID=45354 RepID=A0A1L0GSF1_9ASCO|nr:CIC11C00000002952 [[Candida] intermedia]
MTTVNSNKRDSDDGLDRSSHAQTMPPVSDSASPEPFAEEKKFFESDAGDGTKREDMYLHGKALALCLLSIYFCLFLFALDQTIIVTLLSEVGNKFKGFDKIGWLGSGFLFAMAVLVAFWGKLALLFGRKYTMVAAIILFEAGSLMCALADSMNVLIGGRVLAGVGGGGIQTLVFILITEILPIHKRPLGMALVGSVFAVASVLGPLIGGAFTTHVTWRWCFYINLPVGGLALVLFCWTFNPPKAKGSAREKLRYIDYFGTMLLTSGLVMILVAITLGGRDYPWHSGAVISLFTIGGIITIAFFSWTFKFAKHPLIPWGIAKVYQTTAAGVALFGMFGYFMASLLYLTIYFQVIHNTDAWHSGLHLLPEIVAVVITSMIGGIVVKKATYIKPFAIAGASIGFIGCGLLTLLKVDSSNHEKIGYMIPVGIGIGLQMQSCLLGGQVTAPKFAGGVIFATSWMNFLRSIGGALAATLADATYTTSFVNKVGPALAKLPQSIQEELSHYDLQKLINSYGVIQTMSPESQTFIKNVIMDSIRNVFYMNLGFAVISTIGVIFTTNKRLPTASAAPRDEDETKGETHNDSKEGDVDDDVNHHSPLGSNTESASSVRDTEFASK